jgi:DNA (cytosine-5)-methyltransferase 1
MSPPGVASRARPIAVDLFAGAGGMSLGLEQAGFDVAAAVEYDAVHAAVHKYNFQRTEVLCTDASALSADQLRTAVEAGLALHGRSWDGEIDLIAGGPPCQGFSFIGKRLVDDPRNALVLAFVRLVRELRPRYAVMENVPGMASGGHAGILGQVINELTEARYAVTPPAILNAAHFGVPQDRRRLFLFATREGQARNAMAPKPVTTGRPKRPLPVRAEPLSLDSSYGPSVWDALADLPDADTFPALEHGDSVLLGDEEFASLVAAASPYARMLRGVQLESEDLSYRRDWDPAVLTSSMQTRHTRKSVERFSETHPGDTEPVSRFLRLHPEGLCNTLRAGTGSERGAYTSPRPIHPVWPRVITVREAARLHSFPDWFRLHSTKWHGFRQVGNAVCPLVGRAAGRAVIRALGTVPDRPTEIVCFGDPRLLSSSMKEAAEMLGADPAALPAQRTRKRAAVLAST